MPLDKAQWTFQGPKVRADAQCCCAGLGPRGAQAPLAAGIARQIYETVRVGCVYFSEDRNVLSKLIVCMLDRCSCKIDVVVTWFGGRQHFVQHHAQVQLQ